MLHTEKGCMIYAHAALFCVELWSCSVLYPGHCQKDRVQGGNDDQKNGPGHVRSQQWSRIGECAVFAGTDAIAAQSAGDVGFPLCQGFHIQGIVPARGQAGPAASTGGTDADAPGGNFAQIIAQNADGTKYCAVDHASFFSGDEDHDSDAGEAEHPGHGNGRDGGHMQETQSYGCKNYHDQNGPAQDRCPGRLWAEVGFNGHSIVPGPDIAKVAAPGRTDQKQGGAEEDGHEESSSPE